MIVVQAFHSFYPVLGGIERAMQRIGEELIKMGHNEVHIITSTLGAEDRPRLEEVNGIFVHRVRAWTFHYSDLTIPREMPLELLRRADVVQGWSQNSFFTYRVLREAKKLGKPVAMYFLGVDYLRNHYNPLIRVFGYRYQVWITKRFAEMVDLALVTNEYDRNVLKEKYGLEPMVLPHGVDDIYLKTSNIAKHFREKYRIEGRIVSYIARIHPTKGLDLLIKAFAEVVKHVPDVVLVIAGKGDEGYLRKCLRLAEKLGIRDMVRYLGFISEEDKIALIDASEVVVLPTRHAGESYPLLLDEVASRRRPMVITNVSRALAERAKALGFLVVDPRPEDLAQAILRVLNDNEGGNIVCRVRAWREIAEEILRAYRGIVG